MLKKPILMPLFHTALTGALAGVLLAAAPDAGAQAGDVESSTRLQALDVLNLDLPVSDRRAKAGGGVLRLLIADPELGLVGLYREGDAVLFFETLPVASAAPDAGSEKQQGDLLAARFVREDGRTLAIAGSTAAPQSWYPQAASDIADQGLMKSRQKDGLRMAAVAVAALKTHLYDGLYAADVSLLSRLAQQAPKALGGGDVVAIDEASIPAASERQRLGDRQRKAQMELSLTVHASSPGAIDIELAGARAEARQVVEVDAPGEFRTEIYARLANADDRTLVAQLGGHAETNNVFGPALQVPMSWGTQSIMLDESATSGSLTDDLIQAVSDSAAALSAAHIAARSGNTQLPQWAVQAWSENTVGLRDQLLPMRDDGQAAGDSSAKATYTYYNRLDVHDKPLAVIARHSASVVRNYRKTNATGAVIRSSTYNFCNEGTCALSMTKKCGPVASANSSTGWYMPPVRTSHASDPAGGVMHSCGTRYSLAFKRDRHNCHSDTWTQVRAVKGLSHGAFSGKCLEPKEIAAHCNH